MTSRVSRLNDRPSYDGAQMRSTRLALLVSGRARDGPRCSWRIAGGRSPSPATTRDDILVRYRANTTSVERKAVAGDLNLSLIRMSRSRPGRPSCRGKGISPATVRRELAGDPRISAVGQNFRREIAADPTDEQYF